MLWCMLIVWHDTYILVNLSHPTVTYVFLSPLLLLRPPSFSLKQNKNRVQNYLYSVIPYAKLNGYASNLRIGLYDELSLI
jgi:hypothetical protein